ncbi:hypothetical protein BU14_0098s0002 [Porphyra umbilicalis]|uniref:Uncharacterized protein n=1 Tax=Porphyra umbilicalis TaxID=2786 RepID=A0A1X6PDG2_PORUM|nr:hypothetical protein BU14_0098s0002 [Porphyra umbilicalis]|eukprot:OSX78776.1 hypothetical protein BU14_0098s0002 [Porphyra umbilicalis]
MAALTPPGGGGGGGDEGGRPKRIAAGGAAPDPMGGSQRRGAPPPPPPPTRHAVTQVAGNSTPNETVRADAWAPAPPPALNRATTAVAATAGGGEWVSGDRPHMAALPRVCRGGEGARGGRAPRGGGCARARPPARGGRRGGACGRATIPGGAGRSPSRQSLGCQAPTTGGQGGGAGRARGRPAVCVCEPFFLGGGRQDETRTRSGADTGGGQEADGPGARRSAPKLRGGGGWMAPAASAGRAAGRADAPVARGRRPTAALPGRAVGLGTCTVQICESSANA